MLLWKTFLHSLKLPSKQAVFKLNRVPMDITVFYMFIMLFFISIPSLIQQLTKTSGLGSDMNIVFKLIYFFIFNYLPLTIMIFLLITAFAYLFTWIAKVMKRKLKLQILWKMFAYSTSIPFLLYTVIALFFPISDVFLLITILYTSIMVFQVIRVYPKRVIS